MTNFRLPLQPPTDGSYNDDSILENNNNSYSNADDYPVYDNLTVSMGIGFICLLGIVGNANVIWLLGFRIKRTPFTTYVLNLAVADLTLLTSILSDILCFHILNAIIPFHDVLNFLIFDVLSTMYYGGQLLLTVISVDRCVTVVFPIWHRCHRPSHLSATVCAVIWLLSFLYGVLNLVSYTTKIPTYYELWYIFPTFLLCLPCMIISSLTLLIKVCCKPHRHRKVKLVRAILSAIFFFLILTFPLNCILVMGYYYYTSRHFPRRFALLSACLNSSVNPLIYYLAGRPKRGRSMQSMKVIFQRLFKEEEME